MSPWARDYPAEDLYDVYSVFVKYLNALDLVYGHKHARASKQANIHTHFCNAVLLVWGSLRLTPIIHCLSYWPHSQTLTLSSLAVRVWE